MAKGQHLSSHQRGIVDRYYENLDTITLQKLSELVSELAIAESDEKKTRLWKRVRTALAKTDVPEHDYVQIVERNDVEGLARLVTGLSGKK